MTTKTLSESSDIGNYDVPVDLIRRSRYQPRQDFDSHIISELAESLRNHGQYNAIRLRPISEGATRVYELISGERRWRAAQQLGWNTLRGEIVDHGSEVDYAVEALTDNTKREDLSPIEEARGYRNLMDRFHLTQDEVAQRCATDRVRIAHLLRLLALPPDIHVYFRKEADGASPKLTLGHGKVLAARGLSQKPALIRRLAHSAIDRGWNVRRLEKEVKAVVNQENESRDREDPNIRRLATRVEERICLRTGIDFNQAQGSGEVRIKYNSLEELAGFLERLGIKEEE